MASKRNARAYVDDGHRDAGYQNTAGASHRTRPNLTKNDVQQPAQDAADGQRNDNKAIEASASSISHKLALGAKDAMPVLRASEFGSASPMPSLVTSEVEAASASSAGQPLNFGLVLPGLYRSSYPKSENFGFLQGLGLKTVVSLSKEDELDEKLLSFVSGRGIRHVVFSLGGTKKEAISKNTMASILQVVLDRRHHPLLLHCNRGKHRTGCVVAVLRKLSGWDLQLVLDEYRTYAMPKVRECDVEFIRDFPSASLQGAMQESNRLDPVRVNLFIRTLLFSTVVVVIWLVSGSQLPLAPSLAFP